MRVATSALVSLSLVASFLVGSAATSAETAFHGNQKSHVFHASACRYFSCANCTVEFLSAEDALKAGYQPCGVCKPTAGRDGGKSKVDVASTFVGNTASGILHKLACRHAGCKSCTAFFKTRAEAIAAGYRPGRCCNP